MKSLKKLLNKCGLYALCLGLSLTGLSTVFFDNASAASVYDNVLRSTTNFKISPVYNQPYCPTMPDGGFDYSSSWAGMIKDPQYYYVGQSGESITQAAIDMSNEAGNVLDDTVLGGGSWAVSRVSYNADEVNGTKLSAWFNPAGTMSVKFSTVYGSNAPMAYLYSPDPIYLVIFSLNTNSQSCNKPINAYTSFTGWITQGDNAPDLNAMVSSANGNGQSPPGGWYTQNIFATNVTYDTPPDYEGGTLPDSFVIKKDAKIEVDKLSVDGTSVLIKTKDLNTQLERCVQWTPKVYDGDDLIQTLDPIGNGGWVKFDLPSLGTEYKVVLEAGACPPPFALPTDLYNLHDTTIPLRIDGTSYILSGDTIKNSDGTYNEAPINEDCSLYSSIPDGFACHMRNIFNNFKSFLVGLFVPNTGSLKRSFTAMIDQIKESLGFLFYPFEFLQEFFGLIVNQSGNPVGANCSVGAISVFGSQSANLELCAWRHQFPQYWAFLQTFAKAGVAITLIFMWSRKFKQMIGGSAGEYTDDEDGVTMGKRSEMTNYNNHNNGW